MKSALIVIDVQQSFTRRPYWSDADVPGFIDGLQRLINRCRSAGVPILQVFHIEEDDGPQNPFSRHSGFVKALPQLDLSATEVFHKSVHSAMFASSCEGQSVDYWLRKHGIGRVLISGIRTEQCCETTTRHASDLGYAVTYAMDATLTFPMLSGSGREYTAAEIKDRTELVLAGRFADVTTAETVPL
jgi:nicotinamidase-related amidase